MKKQEEENIKIKIAISLRTLLKMNKNYSQKFENEKDIVDSYEKISIAADIRKATVTHSFSGFARTSMTTVILIIEAMGYKLPDFTKIYSELTDKHIDDFKKVNKKDISNQ